MKVKSGFECKKVLDDHMVIPTGGRMTEFMGTVILSESAASAWSYLEQGCSRQELVEAILKEYDADRKQVEADVDALIERLQSFDLLEV